MDDHLWCASHTGIAVLYSAHIIPLCRAQSGMIYYWPKSENWWSQEIWWEVESVREGMGLMITVVVLALIFVAQHRLCKKLSPTL